MMKQVNPEAYRITQALVLFTVGSLNISSHRTNTNIESHILCFDIQQGTTREKRLITGVPKLFANSGS